MKIIYEIGKNARTKTKPAYLTQKNYETSYLFEQSTHKPFVHF